jgi:hypothetical protein
MKPNTTPIERAFELAATGRFSTVAEVKARVSSEGYPIATLTGGTLTKQLRRIIAKYKHDEPLA